MKRLLIIGIAAGIVILLTVGLLLPAIRQKPQPDSWSMQSPGKTYVVRFSGIASAPSWPFTQPADLRNRKVTINVSKNDEVIVDRVEIYKGDAYDSDFKDLYPDIEWFTENGLHIWNRKDFHGDAPQNKEIVITNRSGESLNYLYVRAGATDLFLIFDLPVDARLNFHAQLDHAEDLVGCKGDFKDRKIGYSEADSSLLPLSKSPNRYVVVIEKNRCSVTGER